MKKKESYSDFQYRVKELDAIKGEVLAHMGRLNACKLKYMEWFKHRRQTFVDALKLLQVSLPQLVPHETRTLGQFRTACRVAVSLPKRGLPVEKCADSMAEFVAFWD